MRRPGVVLAILALVFSGCSGSGDGESLDPTDLPTDTLPTDDPTPTPNNEFVPKFHMHDYWSGRSSVTLFNGQLNIGRDRVQETVISGDNVLVGFVEFGTKADGEQVNLADHTDVVFQGTERIEVKIRWTDATNIPGLKFYFKPSNTPSYTLMGPVQSDQVYTIRLQKGWADMPHQLSLSRWKFKLEAFNPTLDGYPFKVHRAEGSVNVEMTIFNGGDRFIDPPHPYFFASGPVRYAGEINRTFAGCVLVNNTRVGDAPALPNPILVQCGEGLDGFRVDRPHIIPWETTKVVVDLYYNYTGNAKAADVKVGLKFHGSDGTKYRVPNPTQTGAGYARYELASTEAMTDSPYATESDWRFGVYPIVSGQKEYGGEFSGNVHIYVRAVSEGDTSGRGMGN